MCEICHLFIRPFSSCISYIIVSHSVRYINAHVLYLCPLIFSINENAILFLFFIHEIKIICCSEFYLTLVRFAYDSVLYVIIADMIPTGQYTALNMHVEVRSFQHPI